MDIIIDELKGRLQEAILKLSKPKSLYDFLCKKTLEGKLERLEYLEKVLSIDKYKLVFIGQVGAGKTTAICHLFNIIGEFEVSERGKKVKKFQELLATGSGYTTICEVIIKPSENTYFSIEAYTEAELKDLISSFADFIEMKVNPIKYAETTTAKGVNIISPEIDRALRNIINLKKKDREEIIDNKKKNITIDEAEELAKQFSSLENFKEELLKRANFNNRTETNINFEIGDETEWIKKTFEDLNVAKIETLSIPKRIYLYVSDRILNHSYFNSFSEIIDTKGIDANKFRKDLDKYVNQEDTICLYTTKFPNAPDSDILEQMQRHLSFKSKRFHQRFVTFVMPRGQEPESTISSDGTAIGDWEEGIKLRRNTILDTFIQQSLEFSTENIVFYDALRFYYNGKLNLNEGYELEDVENDRNEVINLINVVIKNRVEQTKAEIEQIKNDFFSIEGGSQQITADEEELLKKIHSDIKGFVNLNFVNSEEFVDKFVYYYRNQYHHFTKHAINRRFGIYDEKDYDIYNDSFHLAIDLVRKNTEDFKSKITEVIQKSAIEIQHHELESFIKEILNQLEIFYDIFLKQIGQLVYDEIFNKKFHPQDLTSNFWYHVINRRGKGSGYTDDICTIFSNQLDDINLILKNKTEEFWKSIVIGKTLEFFGQ